MSEPTPHARSNERYWTGQAPDYAANGRRHWSEEPHWGIYEIPEASLCVLGDVAGLDGIELGCGTGYWSAWLTRLGARMTGVDITEAQLATARGLQAEHGLEVPLIRASAEAVPLPDASFDLAFSEYGASLWCEPDRWVAEAARLLRPGGRLVFLTNSVLVTLCIPHEEGYAQQSLLRPQRGMHRVQWATGGVEFHPSHSDWIRILAVHGFVVEALHELYAPDDAQPHEYYDIATTDWARQWPVEDLWTARKPAATPA